MPASVPPAACPATATWVPAANAWAWVEDKHGNVVPFGAEITDFRGDPDTLVGISALPAVGKTGKLTTKAGVYYPTVFDLVIRVQAEAADDHPAAFGAALASRHRDGLARGDLQGIVEARFPRLADQDEAIESFERAMAACRPAPAQCGTGVPENSRLEAVDDMTGA